VKKESVETYGRSLVVSVFGASTLNVAQHSSTFSILKTEDVPVTISPFTIV